MSQSVSTTRVEAGLRNYRLDFARESQWGVTPTDPTFEKYGATIQEFTWAPEAEPQERRAIGHADPVSFEQGSEVHEFTVVYDLVKWFTDETGDPLDAAYDGLFRDDDNILPNSHTVVARESKMNLHPRNTVNGAESRDTHIYSVGRGAYIDEVEVQGDPSDAYPVQVTLTYRAGRGRSYQVDQPEAATELELVSDDPDDEREVTIEAEDGTAATLTLTGDTPVATDGVTFDSIDAIDVAEDGLGTITVSEAGGVELAQVYGASAYNDLEGDLGIPALEGGDREALPEDDPETFIGAEIHRGGAPIDEEIPSATLTVSNNLEELERATQRSMGIHAGNREINFDCEMYGERATHVNIQQSLQTIESDIEWFLASGTIVVEDAVLSEPGDRAAEEGQAVMTADNTFVGKGLSLA